METSGITDTFTRPCLECGATVHTIGGTEHSHECRPPVDMAHAIARAYWNGYDHGYDVAMEVDE